jgi:hypothetical protein
MLEFITSIFDGAVNLLTVNWSFIFCAVLIGFIVEHIKSYFIGSKYEKTAKKWYSLLPVLIGFVIGLFFGESLIPAQYINNTTGSGPRISGILYVVGSGVGAAWLYSSVKLIFPKLTQYISNLLSVKKKK